MVENEKPFIEELKFLFLFCLDATLFKRNGNGVKPPAPPSTIELLSYRFY